MDVSPNITDEDMIEVDKWLKERPDVEGCRIVVDRIYKDEVDGITVTYRYERLH